MDGSAGLAGAAFIERLSGAVRRHDLDALVACFADDYRNETPAHPARSFVGQAQVRRNWEQIFAAVPDLTAEVTWVADDRAVWSEWEMRGTRRDGGAHLMRGVVIFGLRDGQSAWARFYLEPVEQGGGDVNDAVRRTVAGDRASAAGEAPANAGAATR